MYIYGSIHVKKAAALGEAKGELLDFPAGGHILAALGIGGTVG
jgi:hypothetical protein